MPGIARLTSDLLSDIMLSASSIDEKFALAQVSHLWRDVALGTSLLWSSFTATSKVDCLRVPLTLERSGSITTLHIRFRFTTGATDWPADALTALVPYVARIETLDVEFRMAVEATSLLHSDLHFPALQTLRLEGARYSSSPLSLSAPQLRTLAIERFIPENWDTILVPSLQDIRLSDAGDKSVETLSDIFTHCPLAWRVVLHSDSVWDITPYSPEDDQHDFQVFAGGPPPALRELELRIAEKELQRVLNIGFSDVVLDTLTGCIYNGHGLDDVELLAGALLPGLGPLIVFQFLDTSQIELRDDGGHIRRLECWNEDSNFELQDVWTYLSLHYSLHKTVREIRMQNSYWDEYIDIFELYPPQCQDGITLGIQLDWDDLYPSPEQSYDDDSPKTMQISGLAKVEFSAQYTSLVPFQTILDILDRIEPPTGRKVEVCIRDIELDMRATEKNSLVLTAFHANWTMCSHCM
ncbi:hypothetical protein C8R44DRAFT_906834 [Mycena epipterygia]|nr:hypothetical protein C8R44DRAFT_906834 [Mycena epipterygia]